MNVIAKLLSFVRVVRDDANVSDVKIDPGGGANITVEHFAPPGDDSFPLTTDYVLATDVPRTGSKAAAGYIDPVNTPKAVEGDKRVYARDPATGAPVNEVWLKNDGSVLISNDNGNVLLRPDGGSIVTTPASTFDCKADGSIKGDNGSGSFELQAGGDFVVNGATIDTSGNITSPQQVTGSVGVIAAGKQLAGHTHPQGNDSAGDSQVNTGGNL